nr:MAG: hypothetical protein [Bacteriophage sp.]
MIDYIKTWIRIKSIEYFLGIKRSYKIKRNNLDKYLSDLVNLSEEIDKLKKEFNIIISFSSIDTSNFYPSLDIITYIRNELMQDNKNRDILINQLGLDNITIDSNLFYNTGYYFQVYYLMCMFGYEYEEDAEQDKKYKPTSLKYESYYLHSNTYRLSDLTKYYNTFYNYLI